MCLLATQRLIEEVINEFVTNRQPFTALNVSLAVKKKGGTERHRDMKNDIHRATSPIIGSDPSWNRTLIRPHKAPVDAWLYYPTEFDPQDFDKENDDSNQSLAGQFSPTPASPGLSGYHAPLPTPTGAIPANANHRLCVPKRLLKSLGLNPGDVVHVILDRHDRQIHLSSKPDPLATKDLRVDVRQTVRLSPRLLEQAGIRADFFDMNCQNDAITIKVH